MTTVRVTWKPSTVAGWTYCDPEVNEFTLSVPDIDENTVVELTDEQFDIYREWTEREVGGVVIEIRYGEDDWLVIKLDNPPASGMDVVAYNRLVVFGEDDDENDPREPNRQLPHPALAAAWRVFEGGTT